MSEQAAEPVFVNRRDRVTIVYDQYRRAVRVQPYSEKDSRREGCIYEVRGEHYRMFSGNHKQLSELKGETVSPATKSVAPAGAGDVGNGDASSAGGKEGAADTGEVGGEGQQDPTGEPNPTTDEAGDREDGDEDAPEDGGDETESAPETDDADDESETEEDSEDFEDSDDADEDDSGPSRAEINSMTKADLVALCRVNDLDHTGNVAKLRQRLIKALHS